MDKRKRPGNAKLLIVKKSGGYLNPRLFFLFAEKRRVDFFLPLTLRLAPPAQSPRVRHPADGASRTSTAGSSFPWDATGELLSRAAQNGPRHRLPTHPVRIFPRAAPSTIPKP